jgi:lipopolysaccharide transport system permease protein
MSSYAKVLKDLKETFKRTDAALILAWMDIKLRFRGSVLGPLWFTVTITAQIAIIGYIYPKVFGIEDESYLRWLGASLICWQYIAFCISESVNVFVSNKNIYQNNKMPLTFFPLKSSFLALYIFLLQLPVFFVVLIISGTTISFSAAGLFVCGISLIFVFSFLFNILIGMLSLKFHDIPQMITIGLNLAFLVTPIIWMPEMSGNRISILKFNPFYYFIEILRSPLLGREISNETYCGVAFMFLLLLSFTVLIFSKFRSRIVYW